MVVSVSVGATYWGISTQRKDALVINLAGRQRMLIQLMTRLAGNAQHRGGGDHTSELISAAEIFAQTLSALQYGGQAPYIEESNVILPPADSAEVRSALEEVENNWQTFYAAVILISELPPGDARLEAARQTIADLFPILVEQADSVVRLYETESTQKVVRLRNLQIGFFISALVLLWIGFEIIQKAVLHPLSQVGDRARRIGAGDLQTSSVAAYPREISLLDQTFDQMQAQLRESRGELIRWGKTLEARVDQRTRTLDALHEISRNISSRLEVEFVLGSVTEKARELLGAEIATLCLLNEQEKRLEIRAHSGPEQAVIAAQATTQRGLASKVLAHKQVRSCRDGDCEAACQILAGKYRASHLVAPLWAGEDQVIGALCVGSTQTDAFGDEAVALLAKLAGSAAIALENARLYSQAERTATLEERQRIAADMHDRLGQTIGKIGLNIDQAEKFFEGNQLPSARQQLKSARESVDQASQDVRYAIAHLMDNTPIHQSLQSQIEALVGDLRARWGDENSLKWHNRIEKPVLLPRKEREQVLRVASEALSNACNHASATSTDIYLQQRNSDYLLIVADDGDGFDPQDS
ncbi:MAG: GAF domain-containing protein, partial [Chloroflexota bacterium]